MNSMITAILVVTSQIGLIITIIFIIALVFMLKRIKKDERLTHKLVKKFKEEAPARRENLLEMLKTDSNMQENEVQEKLHELVSKENSLYSHTLKIFSGQDRSLITNIDKDIHELIKAYQSISINQVIPSPQEKTDDQDNIDDLEMLRKEKDLAVQERDNLKKDLNTALDSIRKLQAEYTQMYADTAKK